MNAIMINSLARGGAERIALNIASSLANDGRQVVLICLVKKCAYDIPKSLKVIYLVNAQSYKRGFKINKLWMFPKMVLRLRKIIRSNKIKTVQSHLYSSCILNVIVKILGGGQSIQIVNHMHIAYEKANRIGGYLKILFLKFTYRRADLLISISKKMRDDINTQIIRKAKVRHVVIYNPHYIEEIIDKASLPIKGKFKFNESTKYIITAGRLVARKKVDELIVAYSKIESKYKNVELIILGDGEQYAPLKKQTEDLNLGSKIHFLGFSSNPFQYISRAHIFVLASESEGLPNSVVEALICGTPVISTDCPTGPREILAPETDYQFQLSKKIERADYGLLTPVSNIDLLSKAIEEVLDNYTVYTNKAKVGIKYIERFSITNIIKHYKEELI